MFLRTFRLRDRTIVTIRAIRPDDGQQLLEMHQRLSEASVYYRYLRYSLPTLEQLTRLAQMKDDVGAGFVATVETPGETVIGLAYYILEDDPTAAEPAVLVEDQFQGRRLGSTLLQVLGQHALEQGVQVWNALIHPSNEQIMGILRRSGQPFESRYSYGMREVSVWLDPNHQA